MRMLVRIDFLLDRLIRPRDEVMYSSRRLIRVTVSSCSLSRISRTQQRAALARALVQRARIVLADATI
ncbi:hypothetical protein [Burkholderia sp. THE68]|uniref:hypothetical protein n=1 Tax=Burkholderia sp. THE68 TaxID=758782 RepID=UPI0013898D7E|nr:hypothetical protein [Burkholderia sp. THE68]